MSRQLCAMQLSIDASIRTDKGGQRISLRPLPCSDSRKARGSIFRSACGTKMYLWRFGLIPLRSRLSGSRVCALAPSVKSIAKQRTKIQNFLSGISEVATNPVKCGFAPQLCTRMWRRSEQDVHFVPQHAKYPLTIDSSTADTERAEHKSKIS